MSTATVNTTTMNTRTPTRTGSAYPVPVAELAGRVQEQATELGAWPSLRQVMTTHRVGRPKATAVLETLRAAGFDPADPAGPDPVTRDLVADPAFHAHADHDGRGHTDCAYCPDPQDDVTTPAQTSGLDTSGLFSVAVDAHPDTPPTPNPEHTSVHRADPAVAEPPARNTAAVSSPRPGRGWVWPLVVIAAGAFVSIWGGWVGLGALAGFGPIQLLPGIADHIVINSAITLPLGVEAYAAFALRAWLAPGPGISPTARRFARISAIGSLALGGFGQIAYHLMTAAGITSAPWPITAFVSCLPVIVLGCGAALTHLIHHPHPDHQTAQEGTP